MHKTNAMPRATKLQGDPLKTSTRKPSSAINCAFLGRVHFWRSGRCFLLLGTTLQSSTRYAPITTTTKRQTIGSKFNAPDIRKSMRERDRLKKKFNKSRNHEDWEKCRLIRNKIVSMKRKALQDYFQRLCVDRYADQRKFWSTIKTSINSCKSKRNGRIVLKDNGRIIRPGSYVAFLPCRMQFHKR